MINTFEDLKVAVKEQLNIVEILGELTTIDYKGDGLCPFHNDSKKGSFNDKIYLIDVEQEMHDEREEMEMKKIGGKGKNNGK